MPVAPSMSPSRGDASAFTLLELLVTLSIIGILAGLMYAGVQRVLISTREAETENTLHNLQTAVGSYYTDYRRYPADQTATESDVFRTDGRIMDILLASDIEKEPGGLNPRGTVYYSGRQARPLGSGRYHRGVRLDQEGGGDLWDTWGEPFALLLDLDYDGKLDTPGWLLEKVDAPRLPQTILPWSAGPDQDLETGSDNIGLW